MGEIGKEEGEPYRKRRNRERGRGQEKTKQIVRRIEENIKEREGNSKILEREGREDKLEKIYIGKTGEGGGGSSEQ